LRRGVAKRMKKAKAKVGRLKRLRKAGASILNAARAIAVGAAAYSAKVVGMSDWNLRKLRTMVRACTSTRASGSSATLDLMLQRPLRLDPTFRANAEPLIKWARTWYGGNPEERAVMSRAWRTQVAKIGLAPKPWKEVAGPAGAVVATLRRIGWASPAPGVWKEKGGVLLDLGEVTPAALKLKVAKATEAALWAELADHHPELEELREGAWIHPARQAVLRGDPVRGGCSRSVLVGGQWPQLRLFEGGLVGSELCQACKGSAGHRKHRHIECDAWCAERGQYLSDDVNLAKAEGLGGEVVWERALFPVSRLPHVPPVEPEKRRWYKGRAAACFSGQIYLDGSAHVYPWWEALNRAGWSAAQVEDGRLVAALYGTLPGEEQTVPRAELYSLRAVLPMVLPPATVWMDHANHVDAIQKGRAWCTNPLRPNADLWRIVWDCIDDIGGIAEGVLQVKYTPAHTKEKPGENRFEKANRLGNGWADACAKLGRDLHTLPKELVERFRAIRGVVLTYTRWVGEAARLQGTRGGLRDTTPRSDEEAQELARQAKQKAAEAKQRRQQRADLERRMGEVALLRAPWATALKERVRESAPDEEVPRAAPKRPRPEPGPSAPPAPSDDRALALRTRVLRRELESMPAELNPQQEARKRVLEFGLDALEARATRPRVQAPVGGEPAEEPQEPRRPAPADRPIGRAEAAGHVLYRSGNLTWCFLCGAYSEVRMQKLAAQCPGGPAGAGAQQRLRLLKDGYHPATRARFQEKAARASFDELAAAVKRRRVDRPRGGGGGPPGGGGGRPPGGRPGG